MSLDKAFSISQEVYEKDIKTIKEQNLLLQNQLNSLLVSDIGFSIHYISYLDSIQKLCSNNYNPFFYEGRFTEATEVGSEFIKETNIYLMELNNNQIISSSLKERAYNLINVEDIKVEDGWMAVYIDYYFRDVDCDVFSYLIELRKRDALLIENQILLEQLKTHLE